MYRVFGRDRALPDYDGRRSSFLRGDTFGRECRVFLMDSNLRKQHQLTIFVPRIDQLAGQVQIPVWQELYRALINKLGEYILNLHLVDASLPSHLTKQL